jgi:hypothetical protein
MIPQPWQSLTQEAIFAGTFQNGVLNPYTQVWLLGLPILVAIS